MGCTLIPELIKREYSIRALVYQDSENAQRFPVETVSGSVLNPEAVAGLVQGCDTVIHCAAIISIHGDKNGHVRKTNVEGVRNIMEASLKAGVKRVIHISSIHAYNMTPCDQHLDETREFVPVHGHAYDQSKRDGHCLALSYQDKGMEVIVMNPTSMVGPPDFKPSLMGQAICDIYSGRIPSLLPGGFDFVDVRDAANAIANAVTQGTPGQNYLIAGKWHSLKELKSIIEEVGEKKLRIPFIPVWVAKAGLPFIRSYAYVTRQQPLYSKESISALVHSNQHISSDKARKELGFMTRPLKETVSDLVQWYRSTGYIN